MPDIQLTEKHVIRDNSKYFAMLYEFMHLSKNLYNHANYEIRQSLFKSGKRLGYCQVNEILKCDTKYPDYKNMPTAQCAQQTLRLIDKNWKSFENARKDYDKNPSKYKAKPRIPGYLPKDGVYQLILTNQNCKADIANSIIRFPSAFSGFTVETNIFRCDGFKAFNQIRISYRHNRIVLEVVYTVSVPNSTNNDRYLSIDVGVNNLAAVANNFGETPFVINGRPLKSINRYFNKRIAYYKSIADTVNGKRMTRRIGALYYKRNNVISDYMHKASRIIVDEAVRNNVSRIVIGINKDWKFDICARKTAEDGSKKRSRTKAFNQNFMQIPFNDLIRKVTYKASLVGIEVIITEEKYTSGTSFLDGEDPVRENYNKKRRIHRGLFVSDTGIRINADINGALQILKKVCPDAFADGIAGVVLRPVKVAA